MGSSPSLLLCGGTGMLGGEIARRLAERDVATRTLIRPGSPGEQLRDLGTDVARGDLRDPASLRSAVDGVHTIVSTASSLGRILSGEKGLKIRDVDVVGYASLISAAEEVAVERFVYLSAALPPRAAKFAPFAAAKIETEARLGRSSMRSVVIRPDMFQEIWLSPASGFDWPNGRFTIYGRGRATARYVAVDDVAEFTVRLALHDDPPSVVEFGGPEALTRSGVADLFERETGRRLRRRHIPPSALRVGAAVLARPRPALASIMGMALANDLHDATWDDAPLRTAGIDPRPTTTYLRSLVGSAAD